MTSEVDGMGPIERPEDRPEVTPAGPPRCTRSTQPKRQRDRVATWTGSAQASLDYVEIDLAKKKDRNPEFQLVFLHGAARDVEKAIEAAVVDARAAGRSWTEIGRALGVTKQAAAKRYGEPRD